ncbi:MAG: T9SS type A sorting domain-containing protein [Bacteroidia bacterium]|nr:T9SS type A sorting domain-containing protein [Bacteroidia bacterium]
MVCEAYSDKNPIQIFSLTGKLISKWEIKPTNHFNESIDLITPGFYIVLVRENGSYQQIKWIKQ